VRFAARRILPAKRHGRAVCCGLEPADRALRAAATAGEPLAEGALDAFLKLSRGIDRINEQFGVIANYLVLFACLVSAANAAIRYGLNTLLSLSHAVPALGFIQFGLTWYGNHANAFLEAQWYLFTGMVLLGAPFTLKVNEHVRVDLFYGMAPPRTRVVIDIFGTIFFLLPICVILVYFTWFWFVDSWRINETSSNAGGLIRWPVKLLLPVGFFLMALQGVSELIKRFAALMGRYTLEYRYEAPLQ
jgi:TRAP-type mannitol/chloroaromatic compound transport system permease small subunit